MKEYGKEKLIKLLTIVNPQKSSIILEQLYLYENNLKRLDQKYNCGDSIDSDGKIEEYKCSFSIHKNISKFNIRQIRTFQKIDFYYLELIEINKQGEIFIYKFRIPSNSFYKIFYKMSNCHMTKQVNIDNKNIKKSVVFAKNGEEWNELQKYRVL